MNYQHSFAISAAGMDIERLRVEVAALNLANANTVVSPDGKGFQPMRVVSRTAISMTPQDASDFSALVGQGLAAPVTTVEPTGKATREVLEPGHPLANRQGYVAYPSVDPATEMMSMLAASRAYEANVVAMNTARTMAMKALEIGGAT